MDLPTEMRVLSICSGGGGLDAGIRLAIPGARTVCYVEREVPAVAALVAGMAQGALDEAPVWDDASTFNGRRWRGVVDLVAGGTPCQDLSTAGRRAGLSGARSGLFWKFRRIVRHVRPRFVLWENVGGAASALPAVGRAFARAGYRGAWVRLSANDVGASHGRARIFALFCDVAHAAGERRGARRAGPTWERRGLDADKCCNPVVRKDAWPPGQDDIASWQGLIRYAPQFSPAAPESSVRGFIDGLDMVVGGLGRIDLIRLLGNGVVPQQAAAAIRALWPVVAGED